MCSEAFQTPLEGYLYIPVFSPVPFVPSIKERSGFTNPVTPRRHYVPMGACPLHAVHGLLLRSWLCAPKSTPQWGAFLLVTGQESLPHLYAV